MSALPKNMIEAGAMALAVHVSPEHAEESMKHVEAGANYREAATKALTAAGVPELMEALKKSETLLLNCASFGQLNAGQKEILFKAAMDIRDILAGHKDTE